MVGASALRISPITEGRNQSTAGFVNSATGTPALPTSAAACGKPFIDEYIMLSNAVAGRLSPPIGPSLIGHGARLKSLIGVRVSS